MMDTSKIWEDEYQLLLALPDAKLSCEFPSADEGFERLNSYFDGVGGGIEWKKAVWICSSIPRQDEDQEQTVARLADLFREMVSRSRISDFLFLSDGFFEHVFVFPVDQVRSVLEIIVSLPHGIYLTSEDFCWCLEVRMVGSAYMGRSWKCGKILE